MFPASFAACVPVFMATPTSACASAGASFVPSPVIATSRPAGLLAPDQRHLVLGRRFGEEVVHARLGGDRRGGQRVVAGDHHGADAHGAQLAEPLRHAASSRRPSGRSPRARGSSLGDDERRAPWRAMRSTAGVSSEGTSPPDSRTQRMTASLAPLRSSIGPALIPLMRVVAGERHQLRSLRSVRPRRPNFSFASTTMLRPSGVSSARRAGRDPPGIPA